MGGIYGCGCKEVYRLAQILVPTLHPFFFAAASLLFVYFKNVFRSYSILFVIKFYV